jgi:hypothetical protein
MFHTYSSMDADKNLLDVQVPYPTHKGKRKKSWNWEVVNYAVLLWHEKTYQEGKFIAILSLSHNYWTQNE